MILLKSLRKLSPLQLRYHPKFRRFAFFPLRFLLISPEGSQFYPGFQMTPSSLGLPGMQPMHPFYTGFAPNGFGSGSPMMSSPHQQSTMFIASPSSSRSMSLDEEGDGKSQDMDALNALVFLSGDSTHEESQSRSSMGEGSSQHSHPMIPGPFMAANPYAFYPSFPMQGGPQGSQFFQPHHFQQQPAPPQSFQ